jgi:hypothetical protein
MLKSRIVILFVVGLAIYSVSASGLTRMRGSASIQQGSSDARSSDDLAALKGWVVRRVEFQGNATTSDRVVRRACRLKEGDIVTSKKLEESIKGLNRLKLFEKVTAANFSWHKMDANDGSQTREVDLLVSLTERPQR